MVCFGRCEEEVGFIFDMVATGPAMPPAAALLVGNPVETDELDGDEDNSAVPAAADGSAPEATVLAEVA